MSSKTQASLFGEKDKAGWTEALKRLLEDERARAELSARGLERAQTVYAWPIIAQQHLDLFDELLDSKATATLQTPTEKSRQPSPHALIT